MTLRLSMTASNDQHGDPVAWPDKGIAHENLLKITGVLLDAGNSIMAAMTQVLI